MSTKLAENLKSLLQKKDISLSELSVHSGIHKTVISRLLLGKTTNPQIDTLRPIADFFKVTVDQLIGDAPIFSNDAYGIIVPMDRLLVPVIDWKNVPYWLEIKDRFTPKATVDAKSNISRDSFALVVNDHKFEPRISQGTTIIIDPHATPSDGNYILTESENGDVIIKQLIIVNNKAHLKSLGNNFEMSKAKDNYKSFGVVVEAVMEMLTETNLS